ncbi:hypothetical protein SERLA73DRAFT_190301 [Serpula lacrymans var. lacrymans S7.3]|uniref:Transport protein particle component n=2 Tax=Serpula lacrymans var. lacrymans TaxID=341189 RepID=F8QFE6_SERL3|nr:uncharacterized protein SERLADRAFT_479316 [Serpula lacrymans var. lacrymans S7.9]EGN92930.1 hypothetical protein SERLA73DRAFT_190301 [Serpula lacrymans var. lacrymans S7.3]EGO19652.1 hypothetical protein SERLADRAFT_479316 [Serpula lacrymans var. lacrymans S7.9]
MSSRNSFQSAGPSSGGPPALSLATLSDPPARLVDGAAMDYFLIEAVNALRASSAVAATRAKETERAMTEAGLLPTPAPPPSTKNQRESTGSTMGGDRRSVVLDVEEEAVRARLEAIGTHVGANFTERLCRDRPLFGETLDAIKFICKDVWTSCWDKQVDNLRTNHRGVYVLQDNAFKPISRISSYEGRGEATKQARVYVAMSAGIIKGALSRMGLHGTVTPEITNLPQCTFQVKLPKSS